MAFPSVLAPSLLRPPGRGCPATMRLPRRGASAPPRRGRLAASAPLAAPPRPPLLATPPRLPLLANGGSSTGNPPVPWLWARARSARQAARRPPRRGPPPPPPLLELAPSRPEGEGRRGAVAAATSWSSRGETSSSRSRGAAAAASPHAAHARPSAPSTLRAAHACADAGATAAGIGGGGTRGGGGRGGGTVARLAASPPSPAEGAGAARQLGRREGAKSASPWTARAWEEEGGGGAPNAGAEKS
ncbi:translation initiation factor IF-2-like [Panicum virgatum]|uniref:translation initiation factor IF-2-like n=1 Tax=Panicum virgatum TaxID=38727 RepID=UPI0019D64614|nr:translation initiation factor IF-2-like [Panicum virgatum]